METLAVPPFESEAKRNSAAVKTPSKTHLPVIESGTSVAPRQRPRGNAQPSQNLSLGLPPSPSPRNVLSSPLPPPTELQQQTVQPVAETFDAQFQANFPSLSGSQQAISTPTVPVQNPVETANVNQLESLFDSKYPDPFRDTSGSDEPHSLPICRDIGVVDGPTIPTGLELPGTPTKTTSNLLAAPKVGHRRNMSDTTAFNK